VAQEYHQLIVALSGIFFVGWLNLFLPVYVLTDFETLTIINKADTGCSEDTPGEMSAL